MKQPVPLAPRDLAGLAVALDPLRSRICVVPGPAGLRIAGLIHLGEQHAFHGKRQTLHQLSVCVLGPGILLVRYCGLLLMTYRRGRFAFHYGTSARCGEYAARNALAFRLRPGRSVKQLNADQMVDSLSVAVGRSTVAGKNREVLTVHFATKEADGDATDFSHGIPQFLLQMNAGLANGNPGIVNKLTVGKSKEDAVTALYLAGL